MSSQSLNGVLLLCKQLALYLFHPNQDHILIQSLDILFLLLIQFLLLDCLWLLLLKLPSLVLLLIVLFLLLLLNQSLSPVNPMFSLKHQFPVLLEHLHLLTINITSVTLTLLPSPKSRLKFLVIVPYLKVSLFFYSIFLLELTSICFLPAHDIASLYGMSAGHPLLEMVPVLFVSPFCEDLICLFCFYLSLELLFQYILLSRALLVISNV